MLSGFPVCASLRMTVQLSLLVKSSLVEEPDGLSKSHAGRQTRNGSTQNSVEVGLSCRRWKLGIAN